MDTIVNLFATVPAEVAAWLAAIIAVAALARKGWRWLRAAGRRLNSLIDTLVGRPAITHPDRPEEVLVPAQPGLNDRLGGMEAAISRLTDTTIARVETRVEALEAWRASHEVGCSPAQQVTVEVSTPST